MARCAKHVKDPYAVGLPIYSLAHETRGDSIQIVLRVAISSRVSRSRQAEIREVVISSLLLDNDPLKELALSSRADLRAVFKESQNFGEIDAISR